MATTEAPAAAPTQPERAPRDVLAEPDTGKSGPWQRYQDSEELGSEAPAHTWAANDWIVSVGALVLLVMCVALLAKAWRHAFSATSTAGNGVKIALVLAVAAVLVTALAIFFSPYQSCAREHSALWCARATGGA